MVHNKPKTAKSMLEVKDRVDNKIFKTFKQKMPPLTALEQILQRANKLDGEASHCLGEDGLKSILDISKETANEVLILDDPVLCSVQIENLNKR